MKHVITHTVAMRRQRLELMLPTPFRRGLSQIQGSLSRMIAFIMKKPVVISCGFILILGVASALAAQDAAHLPNRCVSRPAITTLTSFPSWNGWGADPGNTRFQPAAAAQLTAADAPRLKLKW